MFVDAMNRSAQENPDRAGNSYRAPHTAKKAHKKWG